MADPSGSRGRGGGRGLEEASGCVLCARFFRFTRNIDRHLSCSPENGNKEIGRQLRGPPELKSASEGRGGSWKSGRSKEGCVNLLLALCR